MSNYYDHQQQPYQQQQYHNYGQQQQYHNYGQQNGQQSEYQDYGQQHQNYNYEQYQQPYNDNSNNYYHQNDVQSMSDIPDRKEKSTPLPATDTGYYTPQPTPQPQQQQRFSQIADINNEKFSRKYMEEEDRRSSCCDKICCGCCTCCPRWCRWLSCIILLIIIALGIVIGVLAALFKTPSVNFDGIQGSPQFGLTGTTVNLNLTLGFTVKNPNIEGVTFKSLTATVNYHGDPTQLGGGTLNDLHIGSNSITNISFPFELNMDTANPGSLTALNSIAGDCGLNSGQAAQDIQLDYKVVATVSIIGIPISIPFSSTISFACPIDASQLSTLSSIESTLTSLSGSNTGSSSNSGLVSSILNSGSLPTDIPSNIGGYSIPSSLPTGL